MTASAGLFIEQPRPWPAGRRKFCRVMSQRQRLNVRIGYILALRNSRRRRGLERVPNDICHQERPMFKELSPLLRQRAVLLTVTRLEEDEIRVNIIPKKLKESENNALTTALKVTGTAEELDRELSSAIVNFVSSCLQMKNSLEKSQAENGRSHLKRRKLKQRQKPRSRSRRIRQSQMLRSLLWPRNRRRSPDRNPQ
jgi:PRTRC genetic system protein E